MKPQINQKRRKFFQQMTMLGGSSLLMQQNNLGLINNALAISDNYSGISDQKSLVCIVLDGGNDAFNMFVPFEADSYQQYNSIRGNLAIPHGQLYPVAGEQHAFHPSMEKVRNLYNENKIAVVSNVGNLYQPLSKEQYLDFKNGDSSIKVPPVLFSHSHQKELAQTCFPPEFGVSHSGWGGRMADLLIQANSNQSISPTFSLAASNLWQAGVQTRSFSLDNSAVENFKFLYNEPAARAASLRNSRRDILNLNYSHYFQQHIAGLTTSTEQNVGAIQQALAQSVGNIGTEYDTTNGLANQLRMIARLIYARNTAGGLGMKRQIFFARLAPFDTHKEQLGTHAALLSTLNEALDSFHRTMVELDMADSVTTFTLSEFGRPMGTNGVGSDHGWGGHSLVMGGAVNGGQIHGDMPDFTLGGSDDSEGNGRIIPTISTEQYGATLAKWMGISDNDLLAMFPNLGNFANHDLGFMTS